MPGLAFDETWFYAPVDPGARTAALPEEEARHASRVLRLRPGAGVIVTDGAGSVYQAVLTNAEGALEIRERVLHQPEPPGLSLAMGLLKGRDAELPVEGACEFDLRAVFLLLTDHSNEFRGQDFTKLVERMRQKSLAALKQAKKAWRTEIHAPVDLRAWREAHRGVPLAVADPGRDTVPSPRPSELHVLTGPEGGWSDAELEYLLGQENAYRLSLGPTRLRAIHAPVAALGNLVGRI